MRWGQYVSTRELLFVLVLLLLRFVLIKEKRSKQIVSKLRDAFVVRLSFCSRMVADSAKTLQYLVLNPRCSVSLFLSMQEGSPDTPAAIDFILSPASEVEMLKPSCDADIDDDVNLDGDDISSTHGGGSSGGAGLGLGVDNVTTAAAAGTVAHAPSSVSSAVLRRPAVVAKALCMLSADELLGEAPLVCAVWRKAAVFAFAEVASDMGGGEGEEGGGEGGGGESLPPPPDVVGSGGGGGGGRALRSRPARGKRNEAVVAAVVVAPPPPRDVWSLEKLVGTFSWGGFLSEGACKQVRGLGRGYSLSIVTAGAGFSGGRARCHTWPSS